MKLLRQMADHALEAHPGPASAVLERLGEADAVALLGRSQVARVAPIVDHLSPQLATAALQGLSPERAAKSLEALGVERAARLLRRVGADHRTAILDLLDPRVADSVRSVIRFPDGSAGALMDPDVLAVPHDLTAREALARVRKAAEFARYNLYILDHETLVGALNLRELLIARPRQRLSDVMMREPHRILATANRAAVVSHPGWRTVHALPVVDASDAYLGAIRYRTLRALEEQTRRDRTGDTETGAALGELISAGAEGLLDALVGGPGRWGEG